MYDVFDNVFLVNPNPGAGLGLHKINYGVNLRWLWSSPSIPIKWLGQRAAQPSLILKRWIIGPREVISVEVGSQTKNKQFYVQRKLFCSNHVEVQ